MHLEWLHPLPTSGRGRVMLFLLPLPVIVEHLLHFSWQQISGVFCPWKATSAHRHDPQCVTYWHHKSVCTLCHHPLLQSGVTPPWNWSTEHIQGGQQQGFAFTLIVQQCLKDSLAKMISLWRYRSLKVRHHFWRIAIKKKLYSCLAVLHSFHPTTAPAIIHFCFSFTFLAIVLLPCLSPQLLTDAAVIFLL